MRKLDVLEILDELHVEIASRSPNAGGWIPCFCPLAPYSGGHKKQREKNPSFFVKVDDRNISGFHCFTCKESGRLSKLARLLGHYTDEDFMPIAIRADLKESPDSYGAFSDETEVIEKPKPLDLAVYGNMFPLAWEDKECRAYLQRRGIGAVTSHILDLKYDPEEHRVLFPVMDREGTLFGYSGRSVRESRYARHRDYEFDKAHFLLGEHLVSNEIPNLLVEGLFAYAHLFEIEADEYCNPIASMGSFLSEHQAEKLIAWNIPTFLCYDDDRAGDQGLYGTIRDGKHTGGGAVDKLRRNIPTFVALYPDALRDIDEITLDQVIEILEREHERY